MENFNYPRDLAGYDPNPSNADWPNKAKLAVQFAGPSLQGFIVSPDSTTRQCFIMNTYSSFEKFKIKCNFSDLYKSRPCGSSFI